MTIQKVLDMVNRQKPNMMDRGIMLTHLNTIENLIYDELVMTHEHTAAEETRPVIDETTDPGTELTIPAPGDMLYVYWLYCAIDSMNMEYDKYNNDRQLFENSYDEASDRWTRTRMPVQKTREFRL